MLKKLTPLLALALWFGCDSNTTVEQRQMLIAAPDTVVFESGQSVKTISITHNCTCPFSWRGEPKDASDSALNVFSGKDDNQAVEISIDRSKVTSDTVKGNWRITSNGYGEKILPVKILR